MVPLFQLVFADARETPGAYVLSLGASLSVEILNDQRQLVIDRSCWMREMMQPSVKRFYILPLTALQQPE